MYGISSQSVTPPTTPPRAEGDSPGSKVCPGAPRKENPVQRVKENSKFSARKRLFTGKVREVCLADVSMVRLGDLGKIRSDSVFSKALLDIAKAREEHKAGQIANLTRGVEDLVVVRNTKTSLPSDQHTSSEASSPSPTSSQTMDYDE